MGSVTTKVEHGIPVTFKVTFGFCGLTFGVDCTRCVYDGTYYSSVTTGYVCLTGR